MPKESESYGGECESRKFLTVQYFTDLAFEVRRLPGSRPAPSARDEIDAPEATPSREESSPEGRDPGKKVPNPARAEPVPPRWTRPWRRSVRESCNITPPSLCTHDHPPTACRRLKGRLGRKPGDLLLFLAGTTSTAAVALSRRIRPRVSGPIISGLPRLLSGWGSESAARWAWTLPAFAG